MRAFTFQPFFDAAASGDVTVVSGCVDAGMPINVRNASGQTPLIVAARAGRHRVVELLLRRGARIDARTAPLFGLREPICANELNDAVQWARATTMAQSLLLSGAPASHEERSEADADDLLDSTDDLLMDAGPLLTAAVCGHVEVVDVLLRAGAIPDGYDRDETPPLVGAAAHGHAEVVDRLLRAGACVDAGSGFTALEEAVVHGHTAVVRRLVEGGADVNRRDADGGTVLMMAATTGRLPIVRLLVEAGADVNALADDECALTCAASCGHLGVYAYLLLLSQPAIQVRGDIALGAYLDYVAQL